MATAKGSYLQVLTFKSNFSPTFIAEVFLWYIYIYNRKAKQLTCLERIGCEHVVQQGNGVGVGDFCSAELSKV